MKVVQTMGYNLFEGVFLVVHGALSPTDAEWNECVAYYVPLLKDGQVEQMPTLVVTDGGGPTATQRAKTNETLRGKVARIAVCSDSMSARMIVNALGLFNRHMHAFPKNQISRALDHLGVAPHLKTRMIGEIQRMQARLAQSSAIATL
jgi:hypothetical protein